MQRLRDLAWSLLSERVWSLAARHVVPPDCYAEFIDDTFHDKQGLVAELLRHAQNVYWLNKHRHAEPIAKALWHDCESLYSKLVRLLFAFFERDGEKSVAAFRL